MQDRSPMQVLLDSLAAMSENVANLTDRLERVERYVLAVYKQAKDEQDDADWWKHDADDDE
ncbi:MAG: hypothetical protein ACE361_19425 [Aureliella sp.]